MGRVSSIDSLKSCALLVDDVMWEGRNVRQQSLPSTKPIADKCAFVRDVVRPISGPGEGKLIYAGRFSLWNIFLANSRKKVLAPLSNYEAALKEASFTWSMHPAKPRNSDCNNRLDFSCVSIK
ncbi:unnamed protein product [Dovyalis caffra]|uniref:Uncharacterized protein n=1 Tax=Dovyalis caffra TaxID=77055 RepID=A0AAV1SBD6_9ROSI|nr:unnamed protein product [Dovyalis caffra]